MLNAAPNGEKLYLQHCSACHGLDGNGGVGIPLALGSFQNSVDNDFLFKSIRYGRPGRVMQPFSSLSDAQINAIIKHMRSWVPGSEKMMASIPVTVKQGDLENGKKVYMKHCAKCHGDNGEGDSGTGVTFSRPRDEEIMAPALNNIGYLKSASDHVIKINSVNGRKGTPMPSFTEKISNQEADDVVAFIRDFENNLLDWKPAEVEEAVIEMESAYSFDETIAKIKKAAMGENFRIIREQYFEDGAFPEEQVNKKQLMVYFCNFQSVNNAINIDPRVGLFMPCRITISEEDGVVMLRSINPSFLSRFYNNAELDKECKELTTMYYSMIEEVTF